MPRQPVASVENNFTKGHITEFTGLNFPENACTDTDNCVFNRTGTVERRLGFDFETNYTSTNMDFTNKATSDFKWENAGGDGNVKVLVKQVGDTLHFFSITTATVATPISGRKLASTITLSTFTASGAESPETIECEFSNGNGYLFVYHPNLDPFYCTYSSGTVTATKITIEIRDFQGIMEPGVPDNFRPGTSSLTSQHLYNLFNQGWTNRSWTAASSTSVSIGGAVPDTRVFTVAAGIPIVGGDTVGGQGFLTDFPTIQVNFNGTVTSYVGTTLTLSITSWTTIYGVRNANNWMISFNEGAKITTFASDVSAYPSNADVWWAFKSSTGVFDPATTVENVTLNSGPAPRGYFTLQAFNQLRGAVSSVTGLTDITTTARPRTGTFFQGRVWYAGVAATGFTENIYFSQITERIDQFGKCHQINDPTSETLFDLLPSDGGIVRIQGSGTVFKLFPIQNGLLVFAANGIWFITGNQGIGFTANDYTVTEISKVESISSTSFVSVQGLPYWWNEEGIYTIIPGQQGLQVKSITLPTISSEYEEIPLVSKLYARGDYNPLTYTVQWAFRGEEETNSTTRYKFNRVLNLNIPTEAFFFWTIGIDGTPCINGITYIAGPAGTSPIPTFRYPTFYTENAIEKFTMSEEMDTDYVDWETFSSPVNYESFFVTGYRLKGQALRKFQPLYVYVFSTNEVNTAYKIQGIRDFANTANSGRFSTEQLVENTSANFDKIFRKHKIRGSGLVLQFKVKSVDGKPFNIMGWSTLDMVNSGI